MSHTLQTLSGVFDPGSDHDDTSQRHIVAATPKGYVHNNRLRAEQSIVKTARLLSSKKKARAGDDDGDHSYAPSSQSSSGSSQSGSQSGSQSEDEDENEAKEDEEEDSGSSSSESSSRKRRKTRRGSVAKQPQGPRCFLCDYCTSQEVRFVTTFIADNIANMEVGLMAEQIRKYIFEKRPEYATGHHGLEVVTIRKHIRQHMLSPTVRIADMMRHLMKLCDTLRGNLEKVDPDTGESTADRSNIDTYLKVVTKVLDMYKMSETNKMLFSSTEK